MRKLIVLLLVFGIGCVAQTKNAIDVQQVLKQQIEEAKAKQNTPAPLKADVVNKKTTSIKKTATKTQAIKVMAASTGFSGYEDYFFKAFILFEFSLLVFLGLIMHRRKLKIVEIERSEFKNGVKLIRAEKVRSVENKELIKVRSGLSQRILPAIRKNKNVAAVAKKLSISKGEVHLAAKISLLISENNAK